MYTFARLQIMHMLRCVCVRACGGCSYVIIIVEIISAVKHKLGVLRVREWNMADFLQAIVHVNTSSLIFHLLIQGILLQLIFKTSEHFLLLVGQ